MCIVCIGLFAFPLSLISRLCSVAVALLRRLLYYFNANSVDPDQMLRCVRSDLYLHFLQYPL